jgi:hypothetical protein
LPVRAHGPQARYADAHEFIEVDAVVRGASAFRHELETAPRPPPLRYHDTSNECQSIELGWGGSRTFVAGGWAGSDSKFGLRLIFVELAFRTRLRSVSNDVNLAFQEVPEPGLA